jgi:predicted GTPase
MENGKVVIFESQLDYHEEEPEYVRKNLNKLCDGNYAVVEDDEEETIYYIPDFLDVLTGATIVRNMERTKKSMHYAIVYGDNPDFDCYEGTLIAENDMYVLINIDDEDF